MLNSLLLRYQNVLNSCLEQSYFMLEEMSCMYSLLTFFLDTINF